ncbi:transglutaminaseTgpA domain-containing protein [Microbacterium hominis]|uniref:transglutaminase family protein n=1 Tax=Microbacterium hominis TaxID=162426 RepID=UPI00076864AC|nr:DUF3488 and transglutaminase-like domain-containing protein [Microbacterium hominis]KXC05676.1 transglutaminase [Microbacterium hominis]
MPSREGRRRRTAQRGELRLSLALWLGLLATLVPLTRVVQSGSWLWGAAGLPLALLTIGYVLRRLRVAATVVTLIELAVWAGAVTAVFFPRDALLGVIPTGTLVEAVPRMIAAASTSIADGIAPLTATTPLSFVIVASLGLLTIALDHVVVTARMPLLASVALVAVWLIPAIAVPAGVDVVAFVLLAVAVLLLIRAETRTRESRAPRRAGGVSAVAVTIGAVAIVTALALGPTIQAATPAAGPGTATMIDPSLDLGADLRRQSDATVLTMRSDSSVVPYLRVATLSVFDGAVWQPDRTSTVDLGGEPLEGLEVGPDIAVAQERTTITVKNLATAYAPVPYAAAQVDGLVGSWRFVPYNRTVMGSQGATQGQEYTVLADVARPTLEQIRATSAGGTGLRIEVDAVPADTPPIIGALAREVTASATTDYDRLIALQDWFRGPAFTYSLDAPVQEGFDGQGSDAVAAFLEAKTGYCVHFAGAFALMARSLGMPTRIVVGFLPGAFTGQVVDGERVVNVTGSQLHAWPEVYFRGIGWVPFEPTKSLGTATRFQSAASSGTDAPTSAPTASPTASATTAPTESVNGPAETAPADAAGAGAALIDPRPVLGVVAAVIVLAILPAAAVAARRMLLRRRASVAAAWRLVQDTAIDAGVPVSSSQTPRAFGAVLVASADAPPDAVSRLVSAVERANYAAGAGADAGARAFGDALGIRAAMLAAMTPARRARVIALPRSLLIRPGSAFADRDAPA